MARLPTLQEEHLTSKMDGISLNDRTNDDDNVDEYNIASYLGQTLLRPDHKSSLLEILRCAVCLEVPKNKPNLQIKCCKFGHHFCTFCHEKLKSCAICRGSLENGRNFVVEEIIMKLSREFGFANSVCLDPSSHPSWPKGSYKCPHCNTGKLASVKLLPHMRQMHKKYLKDKLRANPHTKWFQYCLAVPYEPNERCVFSFHVSEMGLLTFGVLWPDLEGNQPLRTWIQSLNKDSYFYEVQLHVDANQFFGIADQKVLDYAAAENVNNFSKIDTNYPFKTGEKMEFSILVLTQGSPMPDRVQKSIMCKVPTVYQNDRRSRRTIGRNRRRASLRARFREINKSTANEATATLSSTTYTLAL